MPTIQIFSTDIANRTQLNDISEAICWLYPHSIVTVDLQDCDRALRVEGNFPTSECIITLLSMLGFRCEELK